MTATIPDPPRPPRVFLDADVLVAGSASTTGASHLILRLGEIGIVEAIASAQIREEAERALARKLPLALPAFRALADAAVHWRPDPPLEAIAEYTGWADEKDLPILVAAIRESADVFLTFNTRHFRPHSTSPRIERPGAFLQRLRALLQDLSGPVASAEEA